MMKIRGREIHGVNKVTLVLPREDAEDIVFIAKAIPDISVLDEFLVMPTPPVTLGKGNEKTYNHNDSGYIAQVLEYNTKRMAWIVLESLRDNEIEWDKVDMKDPSTWVHYTEEMKDAGFSVIEISLIGDAVVAANSLDEDKLNAAREVFLAGQVVAKNTSGQNTPVENSPSGTPAKS